MKTNSRVTGLFIAAIVLAAVFASSAQAIAAEPSTYGIDFVSPGGIGRAINAQGLIAGSEYTAAQPSGRTVVWSGDTVIPLPLLPGFSAVTAVGINSSGWVAGYAGDPYTTARAVVWKPMGAGYLIIDLGVLPNTTSSWTAGIDDQGRAVGFSTDNPTFPTHTAPFVWTEAGGLVDLRVQGFPNEKPLAISPGGTVATPGHWYRLGNPASVTPLASPPLGFSGSGNYPAAINDAGDQARFQISTGTGFFPYLFRYNHAGTWQQIWPGPAGNLAPFGIGSITAGGDITATVNGVALVAYGPNGTAQPLTNKLSAAYNGDVYTGGPMNASGQIAAQVVIGDSPIRLVRLVPAQPCTAGCIRVASIEMIGRMIGFPPGQCTPTAFNLVSATLKVTNETGTALSGATVTGRFLDHYYLNEPVTGTTDRTGAIRFIHRGKACVGAIAFLVDDVTKFGSVLDFTTGELSDYKIPK